jgi:hypothetical protein
MKLIEGLDIWHAVFERLGAGRTHGSSTAPEPVRVG